jgi:hypothetical protein
MARKGNTISVRLTAAVLVLLAAFTLVYLLGFLLGIEIDFILDRLQSLLIGRSLRGLFFHLGWAIWAAIFLAVIGCCDDAFNMVSPAVGEGGSSAGSSNRPVHIDLNLPPGSRDELYDLVAELDQVDREIRHLSETPVQSAGGIESKQKRLEHLNTVLDGLETRLDQAREMDLARDQERARQRAELDAQLEPLAQMEAARRQAIDDGMTSLRLQLQAQNLYLKDAGEEGPGH